MLGPGSACTAAPVCGSTACRGHYYTATNQADDGYGRANGGVAFYAYSTQADPRSTASSRRAS